MSHTVSFFPRAVIDTRRPPMGSNPQERVLISIHDRSIGPATLDENAWADVLRLQFDDRDVGDGELFASHHAQAVDAFVQKHAHVPHMVVHCTMGVSRSAAVALAIAQWPPGRRLYQQTRPVYNVFREVPNYNRHVYRTLLSTWEEKMAPASDPIAP